MKRSNMDGSSVIAQYESIAAESKRMLEAARRSDWQTVVAIERQCAAMIDQLRTGGDTMRLPPPQLRRKVELIRGILADDAEIRDLAQPWMADVSRFLKSARTQREVDRAYS